MGKLGMETTTRRPNSRYRILQIWANGPILGLGFLSPKQSPPLRRPSARGPVFHAGAFYCVTHVSVLICPGCSFDNDEHGAKSSGPESPAC